MTYSNFSGQRILVTGASGFIGSHLCRKLYSNGAEVHGVSRTEQSGEDNMHWWKGNMDDIGTVYKILNEIKPDIIFHLASHVEGARSQDLVIPTFKSNLATTVNILSVASELGCNRIIITGSLEEPEQGDSGAIPSSPYTAAKWAGSAYARMFHALYKTPVTLARLFMVYGPGQKDLRKLIPYVTCSLLRKEVPKLSSGQRQVDWIFVEDVIEGLISMAHAPNIEGHSIDLGSGNLVTVRSVVEKLAEIINSDVTLLFGDIPERPMEQIRVANTNKTFELIGWQPRVSLEDGLKQTVNSYKVNLKNGIS